MKVSRVIVGLGLSLSIAFGAPVIAEAGSKPTKADKRAMVNANRVCESIPGEVQFENCVIGTFVLERRRYIDGRFFSTNFNRDSDHHIVLTRASKKVK